jgi:hypothetical protein
MPRRTKRIKRTKKTKRTQEVLLRSLSELSGTFDFLFSLYYMEHYTFGGVERHYFVRYEDTLLGYIKKWQYIIIGLVRPTCAEMEPIRALQKLLYEK